MFKSSQQARENFLAEIGAGYFGEYLISQGLVSREQLERGLKKQQSLTTHIKIGELLVKEGFLEARALVQALTEYRAGLRIGELLIHQGDIGFIQLLEALDYQQVHGVQVGEALIRLGYCKPEQIDEVVELQGSLNQTGSEKT